MVTMTAQPGESGGVLEGLEWCLRSDLRLDLDDPALMKSSSVTSDLQMQQKVIIELITQMLLLPPDPGSDGAGVHSQGESGNNWVIQAVQQLLIRALAEEAPPRGLGVHKHFI